MDLKKIIKTVLKILGSILAVCAFYVLLVFTLPLIKVPAEKTDQPKTVEIFIYTNGVHTDIVVPVKSAQKNWSREIPYSNTLSKRTDFRYVGIGWGDKGFYLDTSTWADLKFSTAFKAAFWLSEAAMHCTFYDKMTVGEDCRKIMITEAQYSRLIKFIDESFDRDAAGNPILIPTNAVYGRNDAFYDAKGRYSFLESCNTWTNDALKVAGQNAALWTMLDFGIFRYY